MQFLTCVPNEDLNQHVHLRNLISLRCPHGETLHHWNRGADAQADLNLPWSHMSESTFSNSEAYIYLSVSL